MLQSSKKNSLFLPAREKDKNKLFWRSTWRREYQRRRCSIGEEKNFCSFLHPSPRQLRILGRPKFYFEISIPPYEDVPTDLLSPWLENNSGSTWIDSVIRRRSKRVGKEMPEFILRRLRLLPSTIDHGRLMTDIGDVWPIPTASTMVAPFRGRICTEVTCGTCVRCSWGDLHRRNRAAFRCGKTPKGVGHGRIRTGRS